MAADFVIKTEIDTRGAKEGEATVIASLRSISSAIDNLKTNLATISSAAEQGFKSAAAQMKAFQASIQADTTKITIGVAIDKAQADAAKTQAANVTAQIKAELDKPVDLSKIIKSVEAELSKVKKAMEGVGRTGATGNGQTDTKALVDGMSVAMSAIATATALISATTATFKASIVEMRDGIAGAEQSFLGFAAAASRAAIGASVLGGNAKSATAPLADIRKILGSIDALDFKDLGKAGGSLSSFAESSSMIDVAAVATDHFARAWLSLKEAIRGTNFKAVVANIENIAIALDKITDQKKAIQSLNAFGSAVERLSAEGAGKILNMALSFGSAAGSANKLAEAINSISFSAFEKSNGAFGSMSASMSKAVSDMRVLFTEMKELAPILARIEADTKAISFDGIAGAAERALGPIKAMGEQIANMTRDIVKMADALRVIGSLMAASIAQSGTPLNQAESLIAKAASPAAKKAGVDQAEISSLIARNALIRAHNEAIDRGAAGFQSMLKGINQLSAGAVPLSASLSRITVGGAVLSMNALQASMIRVALAAPSIAASIASAMSTARGAANSVVSSFSSIADAAKSAYFGGVNMFVVTPLLHFAEGVVHVADKYILLKQRLMAVSEGQADFRQKLSDVTDIAQAHRQSIEETGRFYAKLYESTYEAAKAQAEHSHKLLDVAKVGKDVKDMLDGLAFSFSKTGLSAQEASQELDRVFGLVSTSRMTMQQFVAFLKDPQLQKAIEANLGMPMSRVFAEIKKGGDAATVATEKVKGAFANMAALSAVQAASIPRSFAAATTQLQNQWILTIGAIENKTGFMDRINAQVDRLREVIASSAFQKFFGDIIEGVVSIGTSMAKWAGQGEPAAQMLQRLLAHVQNIGKYARLALIDLLPFSNGQNLANAVAGVNKDFDARAKAAKSSPFTEDVHGDSNATAAARARDQLNGVRAELENFNVNGAEVHLKIDKDNVRTETADAVASFADAAKQIAIDMQSAADLGVKGASQSQATAIAQIAEQLQTAREQINRNDISQAVKDRLDETISAFKDKAATLARSIKDLNGETNSISSDDIFASAEGSIYIEKPITKADTAAQALLKTLGSLQAASGALSGVIVPQGAAAAVEVGRRIASPPSVKDAVGAKAANPGLDKIANLKEEINLLRMEQTGDVALIANAKEKLAVEKLVTQAMKDGQKGQVEQLKSLMATRFEEQKRLEWYKEFNTIGQSVGNTLASSMEQVAAKTKTFGQALKDTLATMIKLVAQSLLIKPLVNGIGDQFGKAGISIGDAVGGQASQGLFGAGGTAAASTAFTTAVTTAATTFGSAASAASVELQATVASASTELTATFAAAGTGLDTAITTAATVFSSIIEAAAASFSATTAASSISAALADGGAFAAGGAPVSFFAAGDVFDRPTGFSYGGGKMGVMGEAGPEAVMPLSRGSDGKLGVKSQGGGGQSTQIINNFHIAGDLTDETKAGIVEAIHTAITQRTPGIVSTASTTVARMHRSNPSYLQR